jgi:CubicO group peptidase (beta-lactamase class C family)
MNAIARVKILFFGIVTVILTVVHIHAQDKAGEVDRIFDWTKPTEPGCAVAVSQNGKITVNRAYGSADIESGVPLSTDSVFDVASVRKQFVAAAVLMLVEDGKLSLTDDIRKYIPQLPEYRHKVTIDHLLTHTSGLRDWQVLLNLAGGDPDALTMILRQRELNFVPGDEWGYSNSNFVLLPEIVARASGMAFSEFTRRRIFEPLGMRSSSHPEDPLYFIKNRALAYSKDEKGFKMDMYLGNDRGGAGGLFTTAADLVTWNDALMGGKLGKFVTEKIQEPATLNNGRKLNYARGLHIELRPGRGGRLVWHSGGGAGYSALAGHLPEHKLSVAITCNLDGSARAVYASRLFDLFLPSEAPPAPGPLNSASVSTEQLSAKAGVYFDEKTGLPIQLIVNSRSLNIAGGGPLAAISPDRFRNLRPTLYFMSEAEFELMFISPDQLEIKTKDGVVTRYRRAKNFSPSNKDLTAYLGRFYSDELMGIFDVTLGKGSLMVRSNEAPKALLEFKPVEKDVFMAGQGQIRFTRDNGGRVTGLAYTNPLVRNIKFVLRNDR